MKSIYNILFLAFVCTQFMSAQALVKLFNGENLSGWYAFEAAGGKHADASELFSVSDGMIRLMGNTPGYLMTNTSYRNFELTAEYRWNTDPNAVRRSNSPNSGLMYLIPAAARDTLWPQGIQFQIKQGATGDFILLQHVTLEKNGVRNEPGPSVVSARTGEAELAAGEWNTIKVHCSNGIIKQWVNGTLVNEASNPSVTEGRILLQYEGYPIDFRRVELLPLQ